MTLPMFKNCALFAMVAAIAVCGGGCDQTNSNSGSDPVTATSEQGASTDDHSGWWCVEHGVPEEECSMCSAKAAEEFKAKGDWCEEHNRAKSQCFICDPARAEKFAALYEAKFGEKPPQRP